MSPSVSDAATIDNPVHDAGRKDSEASSLAETTCKPVMAQLKEDEDSLRLPRWSWDTALVDAAAILMPLSLLIYIMFVIPLHDKPLGSESRRYPSLPRTYRDLQDANQVLATLLPIAFAIVIGRLTQEIARWRLERGATLGSLEQLLGSYTFGGTVITHIAFRSLNSLGAGLVLLWSLSPLGSQALLRLLSQEVRIANSTHGLEYLDTAQNVKHVGFATTLGDMDEGRGLVFEYAAHKWNTLLALGQLAEYEHEDIWGNVMIPSLDGLNELANSDDGWRPLSYPPYGPALVGLPHLVHFRQYEENFTFDANSTYIDLDCTNISTFTKGENDTAETLDLGTKWKKSLSETPLLDIIQNDTWNGVSMQTRGNESTHGSFSLAIDRFVDPYWLNHTEQYLRRNLTEHSRANETWLGPYLDSPALLLNESEIEAKPATLLLQAELFPERGLAAHCKVKQVYVETRIRCRNEAAGAGRQTCRAELGRYLPPPHASEAISHLSFPSVFYEITERLPRIADKGSGNADTLLRFLHNPEVANANLALPNKTAYFTDIDRADFSRSFAQLINTYLQLLSMEPAYGHKRPSDLVPRRVITTNATTVAHAYTFEHFYRVSRLWTAVALISGIGFLAGGIASVVFAHMAQGPRVFGYASSVIRDSKLADMPSGTGRKPALEISKTHSARRFRFGYSKFLTERGLRLVGIGEERDIEPLREEKSSKAVAV